MIKFCHNQTFTLLKILLKMKLPLKPILLKLLGMNLLKNQFSHLLFSPHSVFEFENLVFWNAFFRGHPKHETTKELDHRPHSQQLVRIRKQLWPEFFIANVIKDKVSDDIVVGSAFLVLKNELSDGSNLDVKVGLKKHSSQFENDWSQY